ncbi:hypothetical protein ACTXT7_011471, partial [Hymenolepis weldensis]
MKRLKGKVSKAGKWAPHSHDLSEINKQQSVTCCLSLHTRGLQAPKFRHRRIITDSDEK